VRKPSRHVVLEPADEPPCGDEQPVLRHPRVQAGNVQHVGTRDALSLGARRVRQDSSCVDGRETGV
jgi:hypothetical protein